MCGIAALISGNLVQKNAFAEKSKAAIYHRGPDAQEHYIDSDICLVHNRLSILELSEAGAQPMHSANRRYTIAFNGEIYNHLELRKQFLNDTKFKGTSDTETILELFCLQGPEMLQHLVGMWAVLIWDNEAKRLFASRDRFGQKPLFYKYHSDGFYFGSELKLVINQEENLQVDPTSMVEYLSTGNYGHLGTQTFFKDYHHFPPASYAWISKDASDFEPIRYWNLPKLKERDRIKVGSEQILHLKGLIVNAVLSQTLADVPIGLTLSGGIDSTVICGILAKHYSGKLEVFSAISPGHKQDESGFINAVFAAVGRTDWNLNLVDLNNYDFGPDLEDILENQEEPFGDPSIMAHARLMKFAASKNIKVVLGGQGADELFLGYDHALNSVIGQKIKKQPIAAFKEMRLLGWNKTKLSKFFLANTLPRLELNLRMKARENRWQFVPENWINDFDPQKIVRAQQNDVDAIRYESMYGIHLPHLLLYDDRNAMTYSVEGRTPFLDHRIWEYLATLKTADFIENGKRKHLLREACKEYIPELIYNRRDKNAFFTPLNQWLGKNFDHVTETCKAFLSANHYNKLEPVLKLNYQNPQAPEPPRILWRAYCTALFFKVFKIKP